MKLTEEQLRNIVRKGIMESLETMKADYANRHYFDFSEAAQLLNRIENYSGWKRALYRNTGDSFEFYLCPSGTAVGHDEIETLILNKFKGKAETRWIGTQTLVVSFKIPYNKDFRRSEAFGDEKFNSPDPSRVTPAGVPDTK